MYIKTNITITYDVSAVNHNFGRHLWDIPAGSLTEQTCHVLLFFPTICASSNRLPQVFKAISLVYGPIIFLVKLSLLLLYYRLFSRNKTMRYLIYFGIAFQALFYVASIGFYSTAEVLCVSSANAQAKFYTREWVFTIVSGVINVLTDFYVLILPIVMVWSLQLTSRQKIGIIAIFMTGFL